MQLPWDTGGSWLRDCATSRKVAGSISDGIIGIFRWHNPSGRTTALGLTQPLTEMSTRNISWGIKTAGAYGWQSYHFHVPIVLKSGCLSLLEPSGPVQNCHGIVLPLHETLLHMHTHTHTHTHTCTTLSDWWQWRCKRFYMYSLIFTAFQKFGGKNGKQQSNWSHANNLRTTFSEKTKVSHEHEHPTK